MVKLNPVKISQNVSIYPQISPPISGPVPGIQNTYPEEDEHFHSEISIRECSNPKSDVLFFAGNSVSRKPQHAKDDSRLRVRDREGGSVREGV